MKLRSPSKSLAGKFTIAVIAVVVVASAIMGTAYYQYEKRVNLRNLGTHASFTAALMLQSLHHGMLTVERAGIGKTVEALGQLENVRQISIADRAGRVAYSSDPGAIGTRITGPDAMAALKGERPGPSVARTDDGGVILTLHAPVPNAPACSAAACHVHSPSEPVLGAMLTAFDASAIEQGGRDVLYASLVMGALLVAFVSMICMYILYRLVTRPLAELQRGVVRLASGEFVEPIAIHSDDEIGVLARKFNSMALDIQRYKDKLENWAAELELEVDKKAAEIREAQDQLINAEKLASLGRMAAGVAHELNNPLTGIVTFAHLLRDRCPAERRDDIEDLDLIIEQAERCTRIIKGLLGFSRKGSSEKMDVGINDLVQGCISMMQNQSAFREITVSLALAPGLPTVVADPNQIQQVMINLLTNAADAMNNAGTLKVATRRVADHDGEYVEVEVTDSGPGILPEHMGKILEPFYTTKPVGKGTGLGLPVSYGIVKRHGGDILVRSTVGQGATFLVRLPFGPHEAPRPEMKHAPRANEP
jgi:two-component system NtrC family sensor kinase